MYSALKIVTYVSLYVGSLSLSLSLSTIKSNKLYWLSTSQTHVINKWQINASMQPQHHYRFWLSMAFLSCLLIIHGIRVVVKAAEMGDLYKS